MRETLAGRVNSLDNKLGDVADKHARMEERLRYLEQMVGASADKRSRDPISLQDRHARRVEELHGGFSTTAFAYMEFLDKGGINGYASDELSDESLYTDADRLREVGKNIRDKIMDTPFPSGLRGRT